ncbi:unnamed protein product [Brachionus calyciflorus]|uniref:Uncharacterized protein n=1 Tax=Brachionus calyciflorus TaxID=104777 RepID=A0A813ZQC3_9BILA|nr:unnamed protein product [Brachionus calyciflorus]
MKIFYQYFIILYLNYSILCKNNIAELEQKIDEARRLNPFIFGTKGCLFSGCQCPSEYSLTSTISCNGQIYDHFKVEFPTRQNYNRSKINTLIVMNHNFYNLPPKIFKNLIIDNLIMTNNRFEKIFYHSFSDMTSLNSLEFIQNAFVDIEKDSFEPLYDKIKNLVFSGNSFKEPCIEKVKDSIKKFTNLTSLVIQNFNLDDTSEWFKLNSKSLTLLNLAKNNLRKFPYFLNASMKTLNDLYLSSNRIGPKFDMNNLASLADNLKVLDLSQNEIIDFLMSNGPHKIFGNLTKLDLSHNSLRTIYREYFQNMPRLVELNLSNNLIYQIDFEAFKSNPMIETLTLSFNRLNYLDDKLLNTLRNLNKLYVHTNHLDSMINITMMPYLEVLDISDQKSDVFHIHDYSFDRDEPKTKLSVSLIGTPLKRLELGDKAFCSKNSNKIIEYIEFTHYNLHKSNICYLLQLQNSTIDLFKKKRTEFTHDFSHNKVCNCYMINQMQKKGIKFGKSCKIDMDKCVQDLFQQHHKLEFDLNCKNKENYEC